MFAFFYVNCYFFLDNIDIKIYFSNQVAWIKGWKGKQKTKEDKIMRRLSIVNENSVLEESREFRAGQLAARRALDAGINPNAPVRRG